MGQVTVSLNGRVYRLKCEDGDEPRLFALVEHVRARIDGLIGEFGQVGDDQLLLMAALLATDDLLTVQDIDEPPVQRSNISVDQLRM